MADLKKKITYVDARRSLDDFFAPIARFAAPIIDYYSSHCAGGPSRT